MKISADVIQQIKKAILARHPHAATLNHLYTCYKLRDKDIPRIELVKDIEKRFRWDLIHDSKILLFYDEHVDSDRLASYPYHHIIAVGKDTNDTHIDTALKAVVKSLNIQPICEVS